MSYFCDGVYTSGIVDVIIAATLNALNVKLNIFDEGKQHKLKTALTSNNEQDKHQQIQEEIAESTESPENTLLYKTMLAPTTSQNNRNKRNKHAVFCRSK